MREDAIKWDKRYQQGFMPSEPSAFLMHSCKLLQEIFFSAPHPTHQAQKPKALDIACGNGRHSKILASLGFSVEGVDISQVALTHLAELPHITPICADLDDFRISKKYDVILNSFFLNRTLFTPIINALNPRGIVLFETFIDRDSHSIKQDKALYMGELEQVFSPQNHFEILHLHIYENTRAESAYKHIAQLIAQYKPASQSSPKNLHDL